MNLLLLWSSNSYRGKLEIQELVFLKGIVYDRKKESFRTSEINQVALVMSQLSKEIDINKKADSNSNSHLSALVRTKGLEPPPSRTRS